MALHSKNEKNVPEKMTKFGFRLVKEEDKAGLVQGHFDSVAKKYDFSNNVLSFGIQNLWKKLAVDMMGLKSGDRVLDVCGGTADLSLRAAAQVGPSGSVVLYDFNRAMIEVGVGKVAASPRRAGIGFIQGDAEMLSVADGTFDAAMAGFGIRNLTSWERGLEEIHRILKPGGTFMCLEFCQPPSKWFRRLYDFYSFHVMPRVGQLLVGTRSAYLYLPESIRVFPEPPELVRIFGRIGFERTRYRLMTGGIAAIYIAQKPR